MNEEYNPEKRFNKRATEYDKDIDTIIPGYRTLHDMVHHLLKPTIPEEATILVAGSGTGNEAISFAARNPGWHITGFDIAENMIEVSVEKIREQGLLDRVRLIHGSITDVPKGEFDAITSILVMHFMPVDEKIRYLKELFSRLKPGGTLIVVDSMGDVNSDDFKQMAAAWKSFQLEGRTEEDVEETFKHVNEDVYIIPHEDKLLHLAMTGFISIRQFWKCLIFSGFIAKKPS